MYHIEDGFKNDKGFCYANIRNIYFNDKSEMLGNLGIFRYQTSGNGDSSFSGLDQTDGVKIYQTNYDKMKALRIYKDIADYPCVCHDDDKLVSKLQERQKMFF